MKRSYLICAICVSACLGEGDVSPAGRAQQQIPSGMVANQLNEWSNVHHTPGEVPHEYGINLQLWRNDTTIAGFLAEYVGSDADPRMARLDSIKFDKRSGRLSFTARSRWRAAPLTRVYQFDGVIDASSVRGTLNRREWVYSASSPEESIILMRSDLPTGSRSDASFQSWLEERERVLKVQSDFDTPVSSAQQQIPSGMVANQLNEWSSVHITQREDPHAYGITLQIWKNDSTIAGFLAEYGGNVADPRMARLDSIKFDERSGTLSFTATSRRPAILDASRSVVWWNLVYEFNGTVDDSTMRGTLRRRDTAPPARAPEQSIILRRSAMPTVSEADSSFQSWLTESERVLKFQSGGDYAAPPLQSAQGTSAEVEPVCVGQAGQNRDAVSLTGTVSRGEKFVQQIRGGWILSLASAQTVIALLL